MSARDDLIYRITRHCSDETAEQLLDAYRAEVLPKADVVANNLRMLPDPGFFEPGRTYTRQNHDDTAEFQVRSIDTHPDGHPVAFGFYRRQPRTSWHAYSSDDYLDGWTDTTNDTTTGDPA